MNAHRTAKNCDQTVDRVRIDGNGDTDPKILTGSFPVQFSGFSFQFVARDPEPIYAYLNTATNPYRVVASRAGRVVGRGLLRYADIDDGFVECHVVPPEHPMEVT